MIGTPLGRVELEHYRSINDDMVGTIASRATSAQPEVVFTFDHILMPYPNLSIRYFQRTGHFLSVHRIDDFSDPDDASLLANADFMVTITPTGDAHTVPNLPAYIPTSADPALGDARVREQRSLWADHKLSGSRGGNPALSVWSVEMSIELQLPLQAR